MDSKHLRFGDAGRASVVAVVVVGLVAVIGLVAVVALSAGNDSDEAETIVFEVPAGTADRQEAGEEIEIMPSSLTVRVGDTLRIVNEDDVTQTVGPYTVGPNQTLRQTFTEPGTIVGMCSLSPTGEVEIIVEA